MNYDKFLFFSLLRENNKSFDALPYDSMFYSKKADELLSEFETSEQNVNHESQHSCMLNFIEKNKISLIRFI